MENFKQEPTQDEKGERVADILKENMKRILDETAEVREALDEEFVFDDKTVGIMKDSFFQQMRQYPLVQGTLDETLKGMTHEEIEGILDEEINSFENIKEDSLEESPEGLDNSPDQVESKINEMKDQEEIEKGKKLEDVRNNLNI